MSYLNRWWRSCPLWCLLKLSYGSQTRRRSVSIHTKVFILYNDNTIHLTGQFFSNIIYWILVHQTSTCRKIWRYLWYWLDLELASLRFEDSGITVRLNLPLGPVQRLDPFGYSSDAVLRRWTCTERKRSKRWRRAYCRKFSSHCLVRKIFRK